MSTLSLVTRLTLCRYTSGQALTTGLSFADSWNGYAECCSTFIEWLQLSYSKSPLLQFNTHLFFVADDEERQSRKGYSASLLKNVTPTPTPSPTEPTPPITQIPSEQVAEEHAPHEPVFIHFLSRFPYQRSLPSRTYWLQRHS